MRALSKRYVLFHLSRGCIVIVLCVTLAGALSFAACQSAQVRATSTAQRATTTQPATTQITPAPAPTPSPTPLKLPLVAPRIVVSKAKRQLDLYADEHIVRTYPVALGTSPTDDKERQGDRRTPEGEFYVCQKNAHSQFTVSLGLSYPNAEDAARGLRDKLITQAQHDRIVRAIRRKRTPPWDTPLGGQIFLHGGGIGSDWTWGCAALADTDIIELFNALPLGTPVVIEH